MTMFRLPRAGAYKRSVTGIDNGLIEAGGWILDDVGSGMSPVGVVISGLYSQVLIFHGHAPRRRLTPWRGGGPGYGGTSVHEITISYFTGRLQSVRLVHYL